MCTLLEQQHVRTARTALPASLRQAQIRAIQALSDALDATIALNDLAYEHDPNDANELSIVCQQIVCFLDDDAMVPLQRAYDKAARTAALNGCWRE